MSFAALLGNLFNALYIYIYIFLPWKVWICRVICFLCFLVFIFCFLVLVHLILSIGLNLFSVHILFDLAVLFYDYIWGFQRSIKDSNSKRSQGKKNDSFVFLDKNMFFGYVLTERVVPSLFCDWSKILSLLSVIYLPNLFSKLWLIIKKNICFGSWN